MAQEADIEARVEGLLATPVAGLGFQLLEVRYLFEGRWVLRLVIDREEGVGLDDCGAVSELAGRILDVEDPVPTAFSLEVSSPGVFRPLKTLTHYRQSVGKIARFVLAPAPGVGAGPPEEGGQKVDEGAGNDARKNAKAAILRGRISEVKDETLILEMDGETREVPFEGIRKARLDPDL